MRLIVALLTFTLTGPSVGALICDWACAATHQRIEAAGNCHQHSNPQSTSTAAAGHLCHDLALAPSSILTAGRHAGVSAPAIVETLLTLFVESAGGVAQRTRDVAHAPPPPLITPLRI